MEIIRWLCVVYCPSVLTKRGVVEAAALNKLHVLERLFANMDAKLWTEMAADTAVRKDHLGILLWIVPALEPEHEGGKEEMIGRLLLAAAKHGHLEMTMRLQERIDLLSFRRSVDSYNRKALRTAIMRGYFQLAKHLFRPENLKIRQLGKDHFRSCASRGDLELVKWFHSVALGPSAVGWLDKVASAGHLHIVQWVHENLPGDRSSSRAWTL